jgi:hypothetical protein
MNDPHIKALKREIMLLQQQTMVLQKQVVALQRDLVEESRNTSKHIQQLYRYDTDMYEFFMPVVHKVFPNLATDIRRIQDLTKGKGQRNSGKSKDS